MIKLFKVECPSCGGTLKKKGLNKYTCNYCKTDYIMDKDIVVPVIVEKNTSPLSKVFCTIGFLTAFIVFIAIIIPDSKTTTTRPSTNTAYIPPAEETGLKSVFFNSFVKEAYGKDFSDITTEELAKLTGLRFDSSTGDLYYQFDNGDFQEISCPNDTSLESHDLNYFPSLRILDMPDFYLYGEDASNLTNLEELSCGSSTEKILSIIPCPEKLTKLQCDMDVDSFSSSSTEVVDVDSFVNLEELHIYIDSDITAMPEGIGSLTKLKILEIDSNGISSLAMLKNCSKITSLSLDCDELKDIGFISNMPDLEELTIEDTKSISNDVFTQLTKLKKLHLEGNSEMTDYSSIASITQLEDLYLSVGYDNKLPSFDKLKNLTRLSVNHLEDLNQIKKLSELKSLDLYSCNCRNFSILKNFKKLKALKIRNCDNLRDLNTLTKLEELEVIDFSRSENYGEYIESLFSVPNLKELNLDNCKTGIHISKVSSNKNLKILHLNDVSFLDNVYVESDGFATSIWYDDVPLNEHSDLLEKFPNLVELHIQSNELLDVKAMGKLEKLEFLDITNNNITDLTPLKNCKNLKEVRCGENAISEGLELQDQFIIDLSTVHTKSD